MNCLCIQEDLADQPAKRKILPVDSDEIFLLIPSPFLSILVILEI